MTHKFTTLAIALFSIFHSGASLSQSSVTNSPGDPKSNDSNEISGIIQENEKTNLYCSSLLHITGCSGSWISEVIINSLNNPTACTSTNGNAYTVYPPSGTATTSLAQNSTYNLTVTINGMSQSISAWFDWNANGVFESTEWYGFSGNPPLLNVAGTYTIPITVPATAIVGPTGLRIRSRINNINGPTDACMSFGSGETEDYTIQITTPTAINDLSSASSENISIHPNPADAELWVNYSVSYSRNAEINVLDLSGKKLVTLKLLPPVSGINTVKLDLGELKNGFYLLQLITAETSIARHFQVVH